MVNSGFNPKARWDRNILGDQQFDPNNLNERIDVLAFFKTAKAFPRAFFWKNKRYKIKTITYNWQERLGQDLISYFSVATPANLYQISLNHNTLRWQIDKIIE